MSSDIKTKPTTESVTKFLDRVSDQVKRRDSYTILDLMQRITRCQPKMWGDSIVGFDSYHYVYASGKEGDWPVVGFSPRKQALTLYIMSGMEQDPETIRLMQNLGKHTKGKSCLYIKRLSDIDLGVLDQIIQRSVVYMRDKYPTHHE